MRPLNSHFAHNALPTLDSFMKHSKEARVFRRAQAVREVVAGQTVKAVSDTFHFTNSALRKWVKRFAREGTGGLFDRPRSGRAAKMTGDIDTQLNSLIDQDPLQHGSIHSQWNCRELATVLSQQSGVSIGRESVRLALKKNALSDCRPTGKLEPNPADLAYGRLELEALQYWARQDEIILLYQDETVLWRFALPRRGWWRRSQRYRLPTRALSQGQINAQKRLKRQSWQQYRSWSRITSGVLLDVIGAVQYGTSRVFYKIVPHFNANEFRQYIHQVMPTFGATKKKVVMVVDRSGIHRARKLTPTLEHYKDKFELHFLPAHSGHHLNPIAGFWRRMKEVIGAGRGFEDLHQLYRRTRQVLMAHQERPIYEFSW